VTGARTRFYWELSATLLYFKRIHLNSQKTPYCGWEMNIATLR